jgi:hypothetical protein
MEMTRKKILGALLASIGCLSLATSAHADSLFGDFTIAYGGATVPSAGHVTFDLNANGTIAATLTSFNGGIVGFGFDSIGRLPESDFSVSPGNTAGWGSGFGQHMSGFYIGTSPTSVSWTIGNAGMFSSVWQALEGTGSNYDFYLGTNRGSWAANAYGVAAPVPEPETYAMMLAGLGLLGFAAARRKRSAMA